MGDIREFILKQVSEHPDDIVNVVAGHFGVSRQTAHTHVARQVKQGNLIQTGRTRSTRYFLVGGTHIQFTLKLGNIDEDKVWAAYIKPILQNQTENVRRIANYAFTEILNNAIDHSEGTEVWINLEIQNERLEITVLDNGIGIFKKISDALKLESEREAILHLSKGKFTTDPEHHSGQGIFFSSRMVDRFSILSDDLFYSFEKLEWFLSPEKVEAFGKGTNIHMEISLDTKKMPKDIFDMYSDVETGFGKTIVAVSLSSNPNDPHNSRSQAKRLMAGLEKFTTVVLDFANVADIGQAFVDEVFRVFRNEHPGIRIEYINANPEIDKMIKAGLVDAGKQ